MILDDELAIQHAKEPSQGRGGNSVDAETTVTEDLSEGDVLVANPPVIEAQRDTKSAE